MKLEKIVNCNLLATTTGTKQKRRKKIVLTIMCLHIFFVCIFRKWIKLLKKSFFFHFSRLFSYIFFFSPPSPSTRGKVGRRWVVKNSAAGNAFINGEKISLNEQVNE